MKCPLCESKLEYINKKNLVWQCINCSYAIIRESRDEKES